ncbi:MAG: hypothetical protein ABI874_00990 [Chloroflexota bacterium]
MSAEIDKELARRGKSNDLAQELERADLKLTPGEFFMVSGGVVIGPAVPRLCRQFVISPMCK